MPEGNTAILDQARVTPDRWLLATSGDETYAYPPGEWLTIAPRKPFWAASKSRKSKDDSKKVAEVADEYRSLKISDGDVQRVIPGTQDLYLPGKSYTIEGDCSMCRRAQNGNSVIVALTPIWISAYLRNIDTDEYRIELTWVSSLRPNLRMTTRRFPRDEVMDGSKLKTLSKYGVPVASTFAAELVNYLIRFELHNRDFIPTHHTTGHMGWQAGAYSDYFLLGDRTFRATGNGSVELDDDGELKSAGEPISLGFEDVDEAAVKLRNSLKPRGDLAVWQEAAAETEGHPVAVAMLCSSFASALLKPLGREGWATDVSGMTSIGKTIANMLAMSVWGNPNLKDNAGLVRSWNTTSVGAELTAERLGSIPVSLDDTITSRSEREVERLLYQHVNAHGRTRGTQSAGVRRESTWLSNLLSTGEAPILAYTKQGGAVPRVFAFRAKPFGEETAESRQVVDGIKATVLRNYGHAGVRFVQHVAENEHLWIDWERELVESQDELLAEGVEGVQVRQAEHFATLLLAGRLAYEADALPFDPTEDLKTAWTYLREAAPESDTGRAALDYIMDHIKSEPDRMCHVQQAKGRRIVTSDQPHGGWWGYKRKDYVAFIPAKLAALLKEGGFDPPESVITAWHSKGWTEPGEKGRSRLVKRVVTGQPQARLIVFAARRWKALRREA
jgi:hypothetical protein